MSDVLPLVIRLAAFLIPVLFGVAAALIGARSVRTLRRKGDDSVLTYVLSGEVFRHHHRETA